MDEQQIPVAKPVENQPVTEQPGGVCASPKDTASSRAMAALILGILSIVCMGFLTGIPAIIIGKMELNDIKIGKANKAGEGIAKIGFILGIVGTAFTCLVMIVSIGLIVLAGFMEGMEAAQQAAQQTSMIL